MTAEPGSCARTPWPANRRLRCVSSQLQVHAHNARPAGGVHARRTAGAAAQTAAGLNTGRYHAMQTAQDPFYQQLLIQLQNDDRTARVRLVGSREHVASLAAAVAPSCMHPAASGTKKPPVLWGAAEWAELEAWQLAEPLFDQAALEAALDTDEYACDGVCVLAGVMTPSAQKQWTEALRQCQRLNDALVQADWSTCIDWAALGRLPPELPLSPGEIDGALGGAQMIPQNTDDTGVRTLRRNGVLPGAHIWAPSQRDFMLAPSSCPSRLYLTFCGDRRVRHVRTRRIHGLCADAPTDAGAANEATPDR